MKFRWKFVFPRIYSAFHYLVFQLEWFQQKSVINQHSNKSKFISVSKHLILQSDIYFSVASPYTSNKFSKMFNDYGLVIFKFFSSNKIWIIVSSMRRSLGYMPCCVMYISFHFDFWNKMFVDICCGVEVLLMTALPIALLIHFKGSFEGRCGELLQENVAISIYSKMPETRF